MKKNYCLALLFVVTILLISCKKDDPEDPNNLGGNPANVEFTKVGAKFFTSAVKVGDKSFDLVDTITIISNDNGLVTVRAKIEIPPNSELRKFTDYIPATMKDSKGNINTEFRVKVTDEGIQDFFNKDGKQHILVKYSANVGDQYKLTKSDGKTITRTITTKSTNDDFEWGFMKIKVLTVEQDSRVPGIKKFVVKANHKFGPVCLEIYMDDGTVLRTLII